MYTKTLAFILSVLFALQLGCQRSEESTASSFSTKAAAESNQPEPDQSVKALSPEASLATMVLQDDYTMELVAHEPMVEEPVLLAFDGNGRMYVAEMLTYMLDADGTGQMEAKSRIKRLEDTNNDGVMDKSTIFADGLLLPRMILPLDDGKILARETNTFDLILLEDLDGDGVSDKRTTVYVGGPRGGNLEHQPSGLVWGIDNWLYVTITNKRYRFLGDKIITQSLRNGGGQWGLGQDETGRFYYSSAGGEKPVFNFQFPSVYGMIPIGGETTEGFNEVFPIETIPDVQGGPTRIRDDNTLNHITGIAGQSIYLGDKLPELYGHYIAPEPVGNLIRSAKVVRDNGYTVISHPYQEQRKEFIASTDTAFRPVWSDTGPDGTLYIVDMYRGIIQEGNWTPKGSYLRKIIDKFGLADIIGRGRIYRVTKPGIELGAQPKMYSQTPAELVQHLAHPNHWWRINAQKYIVLSRDQSVVPALKEMARSHKNHRARLHALWTLEGLSVLDKALIIEAFSDRHSDVRLAALRISEQLVGDTDQNMVEQWRLLIPSADIELAQQIYLSAFYVKVPLKVRDSIRDDILARFEKSKSLVAIDQATQYQLKEQEKQAALARDNKELAEAMQRGVHHYESLCASCHGDDAKGVQAGELLIAPAFVKNPRVNGDLAILVRSVLHGLSGSIDGQRYAGGMMASIASNGDQWIADVLSYIRNNFENKAPLVLAEDVKRIREMDARKTPWTMDELQQRFGRPLSNKSAWVLSSSHSQKKFEAVVDGNSDWHYWNSESLQVPGMWFQVELPEAHYISRVELDCQKPQWRCGRGFDVLFSKDGKQWEKVDQNLQSGGLRKSDTLGRKARFVRLSLINGSPDQPWGISEINMFGHAVVN